MYPESNAQSSPSKNRNDYSYSGYNKSNNKLLGFGYNISMTKRLLTRRTNSCNLNEVAITPEK